MKPHPLSCSVILAAHGSTATDDANDPLFELAGQVFESGIFSQVTPAFLLGQPQMTSVFSALPPGDVVIVPVMTSDGYYLNEVIPGKLLENKNLDDFRIFITPPLGLHPEIGDLVVQRIEQLYELLPLSSEDTTIIVVGHGTRRNPASGKSTDQLADRLRELLPNQPIRTAFIDQDPSIEQAILEITSPNMLVIPFLISRGPHATVDVPAAFGLPTGPDITFPLLDLVGNGMIVCDLPVGMYPEVPELCIELAADQMLSGTPVNLVSKD